jgi:hypothetical protein
MSTTFLKKSSGGAQKDEGKGCAATPETLVLAAGIEPASLTATDFKSVVFTYFTTRAALACPEGFEPPT